MSRQTTAAADPVPTPRGQPRRKVFHPVALLVGGERHRAHMLNVSVGGACLYARCPLRVWGGVTIEIEDSVLEGRISWVAGDRCGVRFTRPLTPAELNALST